MKTFWTLPNDNEFFNRYATLLPTLYRLGFLAQIVSAFTEIGIIYSLVFSGLMDFWPQYAPLGATVGAFIGTAFLEIGLRKFTPFSVQAILYRRFSGLDLGMSIFILMASITLFATSGLLSFKGSKKMVAAIAPDPKQQSTVKADSLLNIQKIQAQTNYTRDSLEIVNRFDKQIAVISKVYASKISIERTNYANYVAKEKRNQTSFATRKSQIRAKIKSLQADRDQKTADLETAKAGEMAQLNKDKKQTIKQALNEHQTAKKEISSFNIASKEDAKNKVNAYGGGLAYFTIICLFVFVVSVVLNEIHRKGSGIEQRVLPTQYDFSGTIFGDLKNALNNRFQQFARSRIKSIEESTPPAPIPIGPNELYNIANVEQPIFMLNYQSIPEKLRTIEVETRSVSGVKMIEDVEANEKVFNYLEAAQQLEKAGLTDQAEEMKLRAEQVLSMYLGPRVSNSTVSELKQKCIDHLNGNGPNPFGHHHRRPIGFNREESSVNNATVNNPTAKSKLSPKDCLNCGKTYAPKVAWQKYCCSDCKEAYHAEKHGGRTFDAKTYHKSKKRK